MKVIIVGCGPAGLAAAHAAVGLRCNVEVLAPGQKTPQRGPLLMQRPIPGINTDHPDGTIYQRVIGGSILDYRYKLYGDINIGINGDILKPFYHAWRHDETYDKLWGRYRRLITPRMVGTDEMSTLHNEADLVVSTANARVMCTNAEHNFLSKTVAVTPFTSYEGQPDNTLVFNANRAIPWVRSSLVFGHPVTEWPVDNCPDSRVIVEKPIGTDCDCYPHVLRTGRFGAWKNETWVDTAYWDVYGAIESMVNGADIKRRIIG